METLQRLDMPAGVYIDVQMKNEADKTKSARKQLVTKPAAKKPAAKKPTVKKAAPKTEE